ncbi:MAG: hypothetical protein Q7V14_03570, partial [Coriobacteriia bacterium]|nr:hypothetical protein [Coriobacteriia bacterium]
MSSEDTLTVVLTGEGRLDRARVSGLRLGDYEELLAVVRDVLHPSEMEHFTGLTHLRRQQSYLAGRYVAKRALSCYLGGVGMRDIEITNGVFG